MKKYCKNADRSQKPALHWGFPLGAEAPARGEKHSTQRGVSLLIAVMVIVVMVSMIAEMIVSTTVQIELASGTRDRLKAEYLAKSGYNLAAFFLSISHAVDIVRASDKLGALKQEPMDGPQSLWNVLNRLPPIGAKTVDLIKISANSEDDPFKLGRVMNGDIAEQMRQFEDSFGIKIEDESSKININDIIIRDERVLTLLKRLFTGPVEKSYLQKRDLNGEQLVYRVLDFVSTSSETSGESGLGDKDQEYQKDPVPYKAKRAPLDTVAELKMVAGWDDEIFAIFSPYLTVYPFNKAKVQSGSSLNLNGVPRELLASLVPEAAGSDCAEKFAQKLYTAAKKSEARASSAKEVEKFLRDTACLPGKTPDDDGGSSGTIAAGKKADPTSWFGVRSKVFRVTVTAETGNQLRELVSVVQKFDPKETDEVRKSLKEKRALRILYWRFN
jgi:type II secretory pathway component PulK